LESETHHKHHHHHHHHHHHNHREKKNKKWILPAVIIVSAVVVVTAIILTSYVRSNAVYAVTGTASPSTDLRFKEVEYKGDKYRYNNRIITILLAGLDSEGPLVENEGYTVAPRADSINLIVIDTQEKKLSIIGLDRNTLTEIRKYTYNGTDRGLFRDFLCWAYTYGNGGEVSCENLREAVSLLLYDVPVNRYIMANRSSLEGLVELIGSVKVTVPNDDLMEIDPKYKKGSVVEIDASNIEQFVRYRDTSKDFSNEGRMERQKAYLTAAADQILETLTTDPQESWKKIQQMEECIQTDITRSQYLDLVNDLEEIDRDSIEYIIPEGTLSAENRYDEFYPDQEKLLDLVVKTFYRKQ
jgi:anionic cell wall polymer biosynthesis LytR-Cps2A-Psr (LCP) family protein